MRKSILTALLALSFSAVFSQNDSIMIKRLIDETLTNSTAYENLRRICKEAGHRLSGSPQYTKAANMVAQMFREMGVDTVIMQPVMVPNWKRGEKERGHVMISGKRYDLKLLALGNSVGTGPKGITANIIEVNSMAQLHELGNRVK